MPAIKGLADASNVYDSTGIQKLEHKHDSLAIIGAGNIGLEFASLYAHMGTGVTVFETGSR